MKWNQLKQLTAYKVRVERSPKGTPLITLFMGNGGTVQTAYVYSTRSGDMPKIKGDWPEIYARAAHWYEVDGATWSRVRFKRKLKGSRTPNH